MVEGGVSMIAGQRGTVAFERVNSYWARYRNYVY